MWTKRHWRQWPIIEKPVCHPQSYVHNPMWRVQSHTLHIWYDCSMSWQHRLLVSAWVGWRIELPAVELSNHISSCQSAGPASPESRRPDYSFMPASRHLSSSDEALLKELEREIGCDIDAHLPAKCSLKYSWHAFFLTPQAQPFSLVVIDVLMLYHFISFRILSPCMSASDNGISRMDTDACIQACKYRLQNGIHIWRSI